MAAPVPLWTLKAPMSRTGFMLRLLDRVDRLQGTQDGLSLSVAKKRSTVAYEEIHRVKVENVQQSAGIFWGSLFFATAIIFLTFSASTFSVHPMIAIVAAVGAILQAIYSWIALVGVDECHITIETLDGQKHRFIADPDEAEQYLVGLLEY